MSISVVDPTSATCALDGGCGVPYEFVRLRYFFGQRLGVLELTDEQAYVVGKQRFHNRHAHGAGVLCGLAASRYAPGGAVSTTLARVSSGAALDGCGREIVVGWDTCVDVAAWYRVNRETNLDLADPAADTAQHVWVVVCYRECPSDPAPAPRDPCGCEPSGCENSRVREGFELRLVTVSGLPGTPPVPVASGSCPPTVADPCLVLARIDVVLDAAGQVVDLAGIDNTLRTELWSTAALQAALGATFGTEELAAALAGGPRLGPVGFAGTSPTDGTLTVPIVLAPGADGLPSPILGDPTAALTWTVRRLADDGTWQPPAVPAATTWDPAASAVALDFTGTLEPGRYRLVGEVASDVPPVDAAYRELGPARITRWFVLVDTGGVLTLSTSTPQP